MMDVDEITEGLEKLHDILEVDVRHSDAAVVVATLEKKDAAYTLNLLNEAVARLNEIEYRRCPKCRNTYPWLKKTTHVTCRICFAKEAVNRAVVLTTAGEGVGFGVTR